MGELLKRSYWSNWWMELGGGKEVISNNVLYLCNIGILLLLI